MKKFWNGVALLLVVLGGASNVVAFIISVRHGDYMHAALSACFVAMQPVLYRVMVS